MLKVYLVQMESIPGNRDANLQKAASLVEEAKPQAGSLILFPEMFSTGYTPEKAEQIAEYFDDSAELGPTAKFLTDLANRTHCTVFGGGTCIKDGKYTNHVGCFVSGQPHETAGYDKVHPFFPEQNDYTPGQVVTLFKINNINVAPSICFDLRFPELYRDAVRKGAEFFTVQAAWPAKRRDHWEALLKARAIENQAFVAAVNCVTKDGAFSGNSQIVSPTGEVIVQAESGKECVVCADIDIDILEKYRREFPVLSQA